MPRRLMVEVQVTLTSDGAGEAAMRRESNLSVWVKPELDDDGEVLLNVQDIGQALTVLGFRPEDVFPEPS